MKHFFSPTLSCLTRWARRWLTGRGATWRVALLLWLSHVPYLWLYYPGCWGFPDTESSVNHYFGYADFTTWLCGGTAAHPLCNHHPIVYTYLYGGLMQLGAWAGSVEAAVAAFLAVQAAVQAVLLAVVTAESWQKIQKDLRRKMQIDVPGTGIAFIVPLSITNFGGGQVYVSCTGTVNPVVSRHRAPFTFVRPAGRGALPVEV